MSSLSSSNIIHGDLEVTYIQRENNENGMNKEEIESNSQVLIDAGTETVASALSGECANASYYIQTTSMEQSKLKPSRDILLPHQHPSCS